jgi:uncharacterized protein (TIGR02145 family)
MFLSITVLFACNADGAKTSTSDRGELESVSEETSDEDIKNAMLDAYEQSRLQLASEGKSIENISTYANLKQVILKQFNRDNGISAAVRKKINQFNTEDTLLTDSLRVILDMEKAIDLYHKNDSLEKRQMNLNNELAKYGDKIILSGYVERVWRTNEDTETYLISQAGIRVNGKYKRIPSECFLTLMGRRFTGTGNLIPIQVFKNLSETVKTEKGFTKELPVYVALAESSIKQIKDIESESYRILAKINSIEQMVGYNPSKANILKEFRDKLNLSASVMSEAEIILTWLTPEGFDAGFVIERESRLGFTTIAKNADGNTGFADNNLEREVLYKYRVVANKSRNGLDWADSTSIRISFPAPIHFAASTIDDSTIKLTWKDSCNFESGFKIERDDGDGFQFLDEVGANVTIFIDTGLTLGQPYNYRMASFTSTTTSNYSVEARAIAITPLVDIDNNLYQTVVIGDQVWMAENLKVTHYRDGTQINYVSTEDAWKEIKTAAYCIFNNNVSDEYHTYGSLYNWYAVNGDINGDGVKEKELVPEGWHVPTDDDWKKLEMYLGMITTGDVEKDPRSVKKKKKGNPKNLTVEDQKKERKKRRREAEIARLIKVQTTTWGADDTGDRGTNEGSKLAGNADLWADGDLEDNSEFDSNGFHALPGGERDRFGRFNYPNHLAHAYFWSSTEEYSNKAYYRSISYNDSKVSRYSAYVKTGFSVRCVRD